MRISYWSSDVCSSDLSGCRGRAACAAPDRAMRRSFRDLRGLRLGDVHPDILDLQEFVQALLAAEAAIAALLHAAERQVRLHAFAGTIDLHQIGRASCRERVCPYV